MPPESVFKVALRAFKTSMTSLSTSHGVVARSSLIASVRISRTGWNCSRNRASKSWTRAATSGSGIGFSDSYERLAFRYGQDDGQSISISLFVPQHTAQIFSSLAGQYRFPARSEHNGHIAMAVEVCNNRYSIATGLGVY